MAQLCRYELLPQLQKLDRGGDKRVSSFHVFAGEVVGFLRRRQQELAQLQRSSFEQRQSGRLDCAAPTASQRVHCRAWCHCDCSALLSRRALFSRSCACSRSTQAASRSRREPLRAAASSAFAFSAADSALSSSACARVPKAVSTRLQPRKTAAHLRLTLISTFKPFAPMSLTATAAWAPPHPAEDATAPGARASVPDILKFETRDRW